MSLLRPTGRASRGTRAASLGATPLLLFITSSNQLYLLNQDALDYQLGVLVPFLWALGICLVLGLMVVAVSKETWGKRLLWLYYLSGPAFVLFAHCQNSETFLSRFFLGGYAALSALVVLIVISVSLGSRLHPFSVASPFAVLAGAILLWETMVFATGVDPPNPYFGSTEPTLGSSPNDDTIGENLPNIYHLLLDEYQTEFFAETLTPETRTAFGGFVLFHENASIHTTTHMSLASIFTGRRQPPDVSGEQYMFGAFNDESSMLHPLKQRGYRTIVVTFKPYSFELGLFDQTIVHRQNVQGERFDELSRGTFFQLWLYVNAPRALTRWVSRSDWFTELDETELRLLEDHRLLPYGSAIESYLSMRNLMALERDLAASNRYTFVHLLLPHPPYTLESDCSYSGGRTSLEAQCECTTRVVRDYLELLKKLDRYDDALILIHGDHGSYFERVDGKLVPAQINSARTPLAVKLPHADADVPLSVSQAPTTLLDIAPTILSVVGAELPAGLEGHGLPAGPERSTQASPLPAR